MAETGMGEKLLCNFHLMELLDGSAAAHFVAKTIDCRLYFVQSGIPQGELANSFHLEESRNSNFGKIPKIERHIPYTY